MYSYKYNVYSISNVWAHTDTEESPERLKRLDGNVCSKSPCYIVTLDPSKDTEKYIADYKALRSNKKSSYLQLMYVHVAIILYAIYTYTHLYTCINDREISVGNIYLYASIPIHQRSIIQYIYYSYAIYMYTHLYPVEAILQNYYKSYKLDIVHTVPINHFDV